MTVVRDGLAGELWPREIFVDAEILEELIFWAALEASKMDPVLAVLEIDIDTAPWRRNMALAEQVHRAEGASYAAHLRDRVTRPRSNAHSRTVRKLFDSVGFFRRSYSAAQRTGGRR